MIAFLRFLSEAVLFGVENQSSL